MQNWIHRQRSMLRVASETLIKVVLQTVEVNTKEEEDVIKTRQQLSERESQSAMIICRVCARRFFQFPIMFTNNKKWRSASWFTMFDSVFSFPTFLLFSPFRLVRSNTWVQWKHLTLERSIDLCLQTFPKLLLLLVPKVTTRSLYPECIASSIMRVLHC